MGTIMKNAFEAFKALHGFPYKNRYFFRRQSIGVCYVPENAESYKDMYSYKTLKNLVTSWAVNNHEYMKKENITVDDLLNRLFDNIEWEFPSTWLDQLLNFD